MRANRLNIRGILPADRSHQLCQRYSARGRKTQMTTLSASVRLRPTRIGFLVRPDDTAAVRQVMQVCTCLWGGIYNPIIPVCTALPGAWRDPPFREITGPQLARGYLKFFEPDVFVETQDGLAAEIGLADTQLEYGEPRTIPINVFSDSKPDRMPRPFGTSILHVYRSLYEREFRFLSRDGDRVATISTAGADGAFIEAVFGGFPTDGWLAPLQKAYGDAFKPAEAKADAAEFIKIIEDGFRFPLYFTREGLKRDYGGFGSDEPTLFVVDPDSPLDLIDLWNFRLFHSSVLPISTRWFHDSRAFIADFLKTNYRPLPRNTHGMMITPTIQFGRSIGKERAETLVAEARLGAVQECQWALKLWYDHIWEDGIDDHIIRPQPVRVTAAEADHELTASDNGEPDIRFPALAPEFAPEHDNSSARWVNVLRLQNYGSDDRLALVLPTGFGEVTAWRFRLGDAAFVAREGFVLPQRYRGMRHYFRLIYGTQAVTAWLDAHGVKASPSDPGRIAEQVLLSVGGIRGAALLADRETLNLLDQMAKSVRRYADGSIEEFEDRAIAVDRWKALVHRRTNAGPYRWISLDAFVKANVLKLGLSVTCPNCLKKNWVGLATMREQLLCERCLKPFEFPQGTLDFQRTPWRYRVVGPFSVPYFARGAYATVLALRAFADLVAIGDAELTYATGLDFSGIGPSSVEVDFPCWYRRRAMVARNEPPVLVFGEAKSFAAESFTSVDIERISKVAERFPGAFVVFATLKDDLSDAEKASIGELAMRGRTKLESGQPRSPVIVLTGTELFASWHLDQAWKEKGGQHAHFVEPPSVRLDNLWTLAELTQQIYLGLPNSWTHLQQAPSAAVPPKGTA